MLQRLRSQPDSSGIERELKRRVERARLDYERAMAESSKLLEMASKSGDGMAAIQRAQRLQRAATVRYSEALKALSSYVLDR